MLSLSDLLDRYISLLFIDTTGKGGLSVILCVKVRVGYSGQLTFTLFYLYLNFVLALVFGNEIAFPNAGQHLSGTMQVDERKGCDKREISIQCHGQGKCKRIGQSDSLGRPFPINFNNPFIVLKNCP